MNVQCVFGLYMARLDPFDRLGLSAEASVERSVANGFVNGTFSMNDVCNYRRPSLFAVLTIREPENRGKPQITTEKNTDLA